MLWPNLPVWHHICNDEAVCRENLASGDAPFAAPRLKSGRNDLREIRYGVPFLDVGRRSITDRPRTTKTMILDLAIIVFLAGAFGVTAGFALTP